MALSELKLTIDGKEVSGSSGMTILEAAEQVGIPIPTLCHHKELSPAGSCRICVVEVEGAPRLVGACHTPAAEGMVVRTNTARVKRARALTVQLLLAGHTGPCVADNRVADCELHQLAAGVEAGPPVFRVRAPRSHPAEDGNPYVRRDMSKCILCHRCVRACREIAGQNLYSLAYRGGDAKVVVGLDQPLDLEVCKDCGICVDFCPTSALSRQPGAGKAGAPAGQATLPDEAARAGLLGRLKERQRQEGFLSAEFLKDTAAELGLGLGEVYGVATFYAFLFLEPQGRHLIRVCKSVSCDLSESDQVVEAIGKALGIGPGQTTADGRFSLVRVNCIGACDQAPAMLVDDDLHGGLTPEKISEILRSYD